MEQVQSQEYRPAIPSGVRIVAWMMLVYILTGLVYFGVIAFTAHRGEVMFTFFGRDYLASGLISRALGIALVVATFGAMIVATVLTLRGNVVAYWLLVVSNLPGAVGTVLNLANRHFDVMGWVPLTVIWVLVRDFSAFREYGRGRRGRST